MSVKNNFLKNILGGDAIGDGGFYFGDDTHPSAADVVIVSAPWSVTSDLGRGATYTPDAIIDTSHDEDLYDVLTGVSIKGHLATAEIDYNIQELSEYLGREAERVTHHATSGDGVVGDYTLRRVARINEGFAEMHKSLYKQVKHWASEGKYVAVVGGDHSTAFGAVKALSEYHEGLGVLFVDAHADYCREGEMFNYSHRSIARNMVEEIPSLTRLVEVGVRDVSQAEINELQGNDKVKLVLSERVAAKRFEGANWGDICREIIADLPQKVYVSFDIDALKIEFCNNTNSPIPGGMTFDEAIYLVNCITKSGREIVGFDISEIVSSMDNKMDAIVGARLLAKMCMAVLRRG